MATIADVARQAGVATSTVSHVLNGTRFVSLETTRAVREAVVSVGYTPNTLARALARSTTNTVGLAVSSSANRYFGDIINAIEQECTKLGMMVLLANTNDEAGRETAVVEALHGRRVDGIILAPSCDPESDALLYLREKGIPAVVVDRLPEVGLDGVGVENRDALDTMVAHLAGHGHRRIGFLAGQAAFTTAQERQAGYRAGIAANGCIVDDDLISAGHTEVGTARAAAARMLALKAPATAFIGGNNLTTIGIMGAIRDRDLKVPDDIAVVGFDDFDWADMFEPRLTAMVQPCAEIGRTAARLLKSRIDAAQGAPRIMRLKPRFVIRESCGCGRTRRRSAGAGSAGDVQILSERPAHHAKS